MRAQAVVVLRPAERAVIESYSAANARYTSISAGMLPMTSRMKPMMTHTIASKPAPTASRNGRWFGSNSRSTPGTDRLFFVGNDVRHQAQSHGQEDTRMIEQNQSDGDDDRHQQVTR